MGRRVPRQPLEPSRDLEKLVSRPVRLVHLLELRDLGDRLVDRRVERERDELRDPVDVGVRQVEPAPDVADHGARRHRSERDDLRDVLAAVLLRDVADHLVAAPEAEVDVDVGHRDPLGVQVPLEDQLVLDRIDVRDAQAVGDEAARGRAAPRPNRDPVLSRVLDEVPDDQEVSGEPHAVDHPDLVIDPGLVLLEPVTEEPFRGKPLPDGHPLAEAAACHLLEVLVGRAALGDGEVGKRRAVPFEQQVAPSRDRRGVLDRLGEVFEQALHLLARLEVVLLGVAHPIGVLHRLAGLDAEQHFVRGVIVAPEEMAVVRGHERQARAPRERDETGIDRRLLGHPLVLDFQEIIPLPHHRRVGERDALRVGVPLLAQERGDFPAEAGRKRDEPFAAFGEQRAVDPRLVVEALLKTLGDELDQVLVARVILGQQNEMVVGLFLALCGLPIAAVARRHVRFDSDDRADPLLERLLIELDGAEQIAVVRDGDRLHPECDGLLEHLVDLLRAVEKRELGMVVEVDEFRRHQTDSGDWRRATRAILARRTIGPSRSERPGAVHPEVSPPRGRAARWRSGAHASRRTGTQERGALTPTRWWRAACSRCRRRRGSRRRPR